MAELSDRQSAEGPDGAAPSVSTASRRRSSRLGSLGGWLSSLLSRRLSLAAQSASRRRRQRSTSATEEATAAGAESAEESGSRRRRSLSSGERHEINLVYHLLRDHRDALSLCWGGDCGQRPAASCLRDVSDWPDPPELQEAEDAGSHDACAACGRETAAAWESGSQRSLLEGSLSPRLKACDSDSCLSTCSGCSKRFKHQRRTDRWNQEYDREFRERHGFVDIGYSCGYQIK